MTDAPRSVKEALEFARAESKAETQDWENLCQSFVRKSYGALALFASAWAQWLGADPEDKHTGPIEDAPVGAPLCFRGGTFGHIMLAAHPQGDEQRAWSNDLVRTGDIDIVERTRPISQWGQQYVGWLSAINDYDIDLKADKPAKPKQDKFYLRIATAIEKLEGARENASRLGERRDVKLLNREIRDLHELYAELRHA